MCPVCLDASKNTAFNCGHLVCEDCASLYFTPPSRKGTRRARPGALCPICRQGITSSQRVFE